MPPFPFLVHGGAWHRRRVDARGGSSQARRLDALEHMANRAMRRPRNNGTQIEGRVRIDSGASVRASVIVGPTVIGPGVRIADAYLGPYTSNPAPESRGADRAIDHRRRGEQLRVLAIAWFPAFVGRGVRVFRGFSLPRALRLRV